MDTSKQKFISYFLFVGEQCGIAEEAITFYMSLFKNSRLLYIERWSEDEDKEESAGTVKVARLSLNGVNPNILLTKIQQLSWWARSLKYLAHQDNCCENHQFNSGIYRKAVRIITRES